MFLLLRLQLLHFFKAVKPPPPPFSICMIGECGLGCYIDFISTTKENIMRMHKQFREEPRSNFERDECSTKCFFL